MERVQNETIFQYMPDKSTQSKSQESIKTDESIGHQIK